ncbi:MAG: SLC13 family permease [Candidatus Nanosalina sp.]
MEGLPVAGILLAMNVISVFLIVKRHRFDWELNLRKRFGVDRHWWIPVIALSFALLFSIISFSSIHTAFVEKFEIIALIFSFGVMAEGLRASGFFRHLAYRIVERGGGDTSKLILYMFALTSAVTFFTSNDIVVYVLTPIIVSICFQAGIKNTKLMLISQFIAANTLSMGMLVGSPTNLIIAESVGLNFFSYFFLMALPALTSFGGSFVLLKITVKLLRNERIPFFSDLEFTESYSVPDENPAPDFTSKMRDWILIFTFFVGLVAVATFMDYSLLWCAVPAVFTSLTYWHFSREHETGVRYPLKRLPYGIFFFGMTFFIFAEQFSRTGFVNSDLVPFLQNFFQGSIPGTIFAGIFGSGLMVNLFLDLPSAAIIGQIIPKLELGLMTERILTQASLVGLNIGTYVTSIGALAGLIWFDEIRVQRNLEEKAHSEPEEEMIFPDRIDLLRYGFIHFIFTGLIAALFILVEVVLINLVTGVL